MIVVSSFGCIMFFYCQSICYGLHQMTERCRVEVATLIAALGANGACKVSGDAPAGQPAFGACKPSTKALKYARAIAKASGYTLSSATLGDATALSQWIDQHKSAL